MKFNWNNVIAAAGLMAADPSIKGPIQGKGYSVKRNPNKNGKQQLVMIITEGEYAEEENDQ